MHTVTVSNAAIAPTTMNYTVAENPAVSWLSVSPTSGTLTSGQFDNLDVTLDATGLTAGAYNTELIVAGNDTTNLEDTVVVSMVVNNAPIIRVEPDSLFFTLGPGEQDSLTFTIYNDGLGPLNFTITDEDIQKNMPSRMVDRSYIRPEFNIEIPKNSPDWRHGTLAPEGAGGPDLFGYKWIDSDEPGGPTYSWIDISATGTSVPCDINSISKDGILGDDDYEGPFPIGFTFNYYGIDQTEFYIQSNGCIGFDDFEVTLTNQQIPVADSYNNLIAWLWDDLDPGNPLSHVYYQTIGNMLVVQFDHYFEYPDGNAWVDAEIILYASGKIKVQYGHIEPLFNLIESTVGIENFDGTDGLQVVFNGPYLHENLALVFASESDWLSENPSSGTIAAGNSLNVWAVANSTGLLGGNYLANPIIDSNDPVNPTVTKPVVQMTVTGEANISTAPDPLSFDTTFVNDSTEALLTVSNNGSGVLNVTNVTSTNSTFTTDMTSFTVSPLSSVDITVTFAPTSQGTETGWIIIASDDPDTPLDTTSVEGTGVFPPQISVDPSALTDSITVNDSMDVIIQIGNTAVAGAAALNWSASLQTSAKLAENSLTIGNTRNVALIPNSPKNHSISTDVLPQEVEIDIVSEVASSEKNVMSSEEGLGSLVPTENVLGEEIFGSTANPFTGTLRDRGNIFSVSTSTTLIEHRFYLNVPTDDELTFFVYRGTAVIGTYDKISEVHFANSGTGQGFYSSGPISVALDAGFYYYIGAAWPSTANNTYYRGSTATPIPASFGALETGIPANIAGGFPPAATATNGTYGSGGFSPYYCAIVTQSSPPFIKLLEPTSGSVDPGDTQNLNVRIYGLEVPDTVYTANIEITSNDVANPVVDIPVEIEVRDSVTSVRILDPLPTTFAINQNYPNPFNPTTTFSYQLPRVADVKLIVYNILGQKVRTLINQQIEPGYHSVEWNGLNDSGDQVATGLYIYRFEAGKYVKTMKMMMLK
jgi:hypothetical protein